MISPITFHHQLINSVVNNLTLDDDAPDSLAFLIRSELLRRTREIMDYRNGILSQKERQTKVSAEIFFNGDIQAYSEQLAKATNEDPDFYYTIELASLGRSTILAIDL